eukprot:TRINITY_DN11612_c0_g3_i1.p1 TRINITY_DN11612_c0_g3~~TRINITY_DN11612_c0_g3_i1.p1  ORF type:complete len:224 (+),score=46.59 TRINITY_DN11612_c0_g3_i1:91-762(+)
MGMRTSDEIKIALHEFISSLYIMEAEPEYHQYKIVVLGDGTVGKTSLILRFVEDSFGKSYKQTIGVDFFSKRFQLTPAVQVATQVWDIGGQSIFAKMIYTYIKDSNAVVLAYDITNYNSFANLIDWLGLVQKSFEGKDLPLIALVANKIDLFHMQAVDLKTHKEFADKYKLLSFFTSAKTGDQVNIIFYKLAAMLSGVEFKKEVVQVLSACTASWHRRWCRQR